jgi:hypothetical protein
MNFILQQWGGNYDVKPAINYTPARIARLLEYKKKDNWKLHAYSTVKIIAFTQL